MQIQVFTIPVSEASESVAELNKFLATNKVADVEQQFVNSGERSFWSFCVRYIASTNQLQTNVPKVKIDYRQVLSEKHFAIFSKLREIRKRLATEDAVPAYAVFTDEELSKIAQFDTISISQTRKIAGIGEKRMAKYGEKLIAIYHETTGESD